MSSNWRTSSNSNPKSNYWKNSNQKKRKYGHNLEPGMRGFLCTCGGKFREKECIRDSYNLLNEFADNLFGPEKSGQINESEKTPELNDVDASLEEELAALKEESQKPPGQKRFQVVESGANGVVFIKTNVPDPCKLAHSIVSTVAETKIQRSKFLFRLLPVEITCKAFLNELSVAAKPLLEKYFKAGEKTFAVAFSYRNNKNLTRDAVIELLATEVLALNPTNKVDLTTPQLVVMVEVIRNVCCLAVVPDYYSLKKYNILELSGGQINPQIDQNDEDEPPSSEYEKASLDAASTSQEESESKDDNKP